MKRWEQAVREQHEQRELALLADSLRAARERAGMSTREAGRATGYSQPALCNWERGRFIPSARALVRLALAYGVSLPALCGANRPARTRRAR